MSKKNITLGIFGGGQLGKFLVQSARKLKIKTIVYTDSNDSPAIYYADDFYVAKYTNKKTINKFIKKIDVATFEFENIPFNTLRYVTKKIKVYPNPNIISILQDRLKEKNFLNFNKINTTKYFNLKNINKKKINKNFFPAIAKTRTLGYDGKGQTFFKNKKTFLKYQFKNQNYIIEKLVNFKKEISIIITRNKKQIYCFDAFQNIHKEQILKFSYSDANINKKINLEAKKIAEKIVKKLDYIGTMCVEFFITNQNKILVNEIAPRVHNSGHLTMNAYNVSQFENHIRAVCNIKIIKPKKIHKMMMNNILGKEIKYYRSKIIKKNEYLFDYGKQEIKEKRKMGHLTKLI